MCSDLGCRKVTLARLENGWEKARMEAVEVGDGPNEGISRGD